MKCKSVSHFQELRLICKTFYFIELYKSYESDT